nr:hypothetical protein [Micromonospora sp. DSM 115978]
MSTGIESYTDLEPIDALFPFVGSEVGLVIATAVLWIGFHVWHVRSENKEYRHSLTAIAEKKAADAPSPAEVDTTEEVTVTSA